MTREAFTVDPGLLPMVEATRDRGLAAVGDFTAGEAQRLAPVATGELRASIHTEDDGKGSVRVTADSDHAVFVEFGTRNMAPEPFLTPAALSAQARGEQIIAGQAR